MGITSTTIIYIEFPTGRGEFICEVSKIIAKFYEFWNFRSILFPPFYLEKSRSDFTLDQSYAAQLRTRCPQSGGEQNIFPLDFVSPTTFDNAYFKNLLSFKGLLNSDQVLVYKNQESLELVKRYAESNAVCRINGEDEEHLSIDRP
ncbi:Peroxidase superfamily protein [Perilla frutescens var. frutescens]|nr:Peroxidase superfamily protein [Perilla frutescens var. frutescens]